MICLWQELSLSREVIMTHSFFFFAGIAAMICLWQELGLSREPKVEHANTPVLVYGASSSLGCFAVQLLRIAGAHAMEWFPFLLRLSAVEKLLTLADHMSAVC